MQMDRVVSSFASRRRLPGSPPPGVRTVLDFLIHRYPLIPREVWESRFERGLILDDGGPLPLDAPFVPGKEVLYFREIFGAEPEVRRDVAIAYEDDHLLVADKPHMLPVVPSGPYIHNCLLAILRHRPGCEDLVPLHRIDRDAAGLVAFSKNPLTRGPLSRLFGPGHARKEYRAICEVRAAPPPRRFEVSGHIALDVPFWKRGLAPGRPPNSRTRASVLRIHNGLAYLKLEPLTGKTHQLRVHMASVDLPICNDRVYGEGLMPGAGQVSAPLQLLARGLRIVHPVTGEKLSIRSSRRLAGMVLL